ncbi:menin-like protein [Leptotrombidium deliense]|uniref:Menin n=1 Tax=Leptotrombidium deliense TaxID=299467 RepID=A0A443SGU9_9ACAR|nr:menin-like protein [Leptotrombidium deliense]
MNTTEASTLIDNDLECRKQFFPLNNFDSVLKLFEFELDSFEIPNFTFLSLVLGFIEDIFTAKKSNTSRIHSDTWLRYLSGVKNTNFIKVHRVYSSVAQKCPNSSPQSSSKGEKESEIRFPAIEWSAVEELYNKFVNKIRTGFVNNNNERTATKEIIKKVSDIIWSTLTKNYYKDKPHLQTLYSYSTGNKLDCFGVAFTVVAACQILGFHDVSLALSEDHAWVIYGEEGNKLSAEVTWHGKGDEHKRGQPIDFSSKQWLYLNGHAVKCTPKMIVSALVYSINSTIDAKSESEELAVLQQKLLWLCYNRGHLQMYPMAVASLADLEEISSTPGASVTPLQLFFEAIEIAKTKYDDHHVYPYEYLAIYYFRNALYKDALTMLAKSAAVIAKYNCSRDDEEIFKYFVEASTNFITDIFDEMKEKISKSSDNCFYNLRDDARCLAELLAYYDGLCEWEEAAPNNVIDTRFAKSFTDCLSAFPETTRQSVDIEHSESYENCKRRKVSSNGDFECSVIKSEAITEPSLSKSENFPDEHSDKIRVTLRSYKMIAISGLLVSKKVNSSAIQLQLTAQSRTSVTKRRKIEI